VLRVRRVTAQRGSAADGGAGLIEGGEARLPRRCLERARAA